jgi:hypothetical protein
MEESSAGKREYGDKGRWVKYWARLGCWISPCYGPFSFGGRFETYGLFVSSILQFFSGRGEPRITETADTESAGMEAHLSNLTFLFYLPEDGHMIGRNI